MADRECPVEGCPTRHDRAMLMCRRHWYKVPKPLRDELWKVYRSEGVLSEEYMDARKACIEAAEEATIVWSATVDDPHMMRTHTFEVEADSEEEAKLAAARRAHVEEIGKTRKTPTVSVLRRAASYTTLEPVR